MRSLDERLVFSSGQGRRVDLGGLGVVFKLMSESTGRAFSVVEHPVAPRTLVPPHVHHAEHELSYILDGEIGARIGDEVLTARPGDYVFKPKDTPHTFWNATDAPARLIEFIAPGGFEHFFEEMAKLVPPDGLPDFERVGALGARYELGFEPSWIPELVQRYGLKVLGRG